MNAQKFTQKSLEAIQEAQNIAVSYTHLAVYKRQALQYKLPFRGLVFPRLGFLSAYAGKGRIFPVF